ncbi:MAG TPA: adenylate/guanylate cyclase domain-containing protein [Actinomycetota bacterium]|nr:adenylate/guanylate cyclase domain-containing protein [Actinomycetota bacterium]
MDGLTRDELIRRTGVDAERLDRMIALGLISPRETEPSFGGGDIHRVRLFDGLDRGGLPLEAVADAVRHGDLSFAFLDLPYWERFGSLTDKTLREVADESGVGLDILGVIRESNGYARPDPHDAAREDELPQIELSKASIAAGVDPLALERQIRVWGESLRKIAEADANFYHTQFEIPLLKAGLTESQMMEVGAQSAVMMAPLLDAAILAMYHAQSEHTWMANIVEAVESTLERTGRHRAEVNPPAICFLDLTGYTRLTEEQGDQAAASLAASFTQQVYRSSRSYNGRPVKWLGDGVMIFFEQAGMAVSAALEMVERIPTAGLPPAHVGIDAGPVVYQDGDYFGRTVNVAARISGRATAGQVLVSDRVRSSIGEHDARFVDVGSFELKGIIEPLRLYRAERDGGGRADG